MYFHPDDIAPGYESYKPFAEELFSEHYPSSDFSEAPPVLRHLVEGNKVSALVFSAYKATVPFNPTILIIDDGEEVYGFDVGEIAAAEVQLANIDGNGGDELIMHINLGGNSSSAFSFITRIYKMENCESHLLFESVFKDAPFDSGFRISVLDGYKLLVRNEFTNAQWETEADRAWAFPADEILVRAPHLFDENGFALNEYKNQEYPNIDTGNFQAVSAVDIDDDGQLEILTEELIILMSRYHFQTVIGLGFNVMKYDEKTKEMTIVKSDFIAIPPGGNFTDYSFGDLR